MAGAVAEARPTFAGIRLLGVLAGLAAPSPAFAGAWGAPEGGQGIVTVTAGERDETAYSETSVYIEAPLGADWSVVAAPWLIQDDIAEGLDGLRGEMALAAKTEIAALGGGVMALQGGAIWRYDTGGACETGAELRWLGGASFGPGGRGFVNLEAAARAFDGGCRNERYDFTVGYRPNEGWLGMAQIFVDDRNGLEEEALRAQFTVVRFDSAGRGLQLGVRARVDGDEMEPALVLGFWGRGD